MERPDASTELAEDVLEEELHEGGGGGGPPKWHRCGVAEEFQTLCTLSAYKDKGSEIARPTP